MKDIIDLIKSADWWDLYILLLGLYLISARKREITENPRVKRPINILFASLFIVLLSHSFLFKSSLFLIYTSSIIILIFLYVMVLNLGNPQKLSYEYHLLRHFKKNLKKEDIFNWRCNYESHIKYYLTDLGKFKYGMFYLRYVAKKTSSDICFEIIESLEKLKLKDSEKAKLYLLEFQIYLQFEAFRSWKNKYEVIKSLLTEDDKCYIEAMLAYYELNLEESELLFQKLLATTKSPKYKQVAENNLTVIAENKSDHVEWNDYARKSFTTSATVKANTNEATYNLILNYLHHNKKADAQKLFDDYIRRLPKNTLEDRLLIANEKINYYRKIEDTGKINDQIEAVFEEYNKERASRKYIMLISLLRISSNNRGFKFKEIWNEIDRNQEELLKQDFRHLVYFTNEINAINAHIDASSLLEKCIDKVKKLDIDAQIGQLRNEDVRTKRKYFKFKAQLALMHLDNVSSISDFKKAFRNNLSTLEELIEFDEKQSNAFNLLESLFLKLDQTAWGIEIYIKQFHQLHNSEVLVPLYQELDNIISKSLNVVQKANKAIFMMEYHLQIAYYYLWIEEVEKSYRHFRLFKASGVNTLNYAEWLRERFNLLEAKFKNRIAIP